MSPNAPTADTGSASAPRGSSARATRSASREPPRQAPPASPRAGGGAGRGGRARHPPDRDGRTLLAGGILLVLGRAVPFTLSEVGAIVGPVGSEAWRYVTAPFAYDDVGALLVTGLAIWVFGSHRAPPRFLATAP